VQAAGVISRRRGLGSLARTVTVQDSLGKLGRVLRWRDACQGSSKAVAAMPSHFNRSNAALNCVPPGVIAALGDDAERARCDYWSCKT